jgi:large subunit ribosomal protein L7/L12
MSDKSNQIIEILKSLTLLESLELINDIEKTFNINISNISQVQNKTLTSDKNINNEVVEEKSLFNITLLDIPLDKKISVLKVVRTITGLGLKESKDIVDNIPKILKENIKKEEVEKIKNELEALGAKVQII